MGGSILRNPFFFLILAVIGAEAVAAPSTTIPLPQFQEKMRKHMGALNAKASASVYVQVLGQSAPLFAHNEDGKIVPASNAKLVTTIAALERLGPGYQFQTKVYQKGKDLILAGNGDPYLVSERLWLLARDVARSGIKEVASIRVHNGAYVENYRGLIDWDDSGEPFTAIVSPTSLNFNSVEVHVVPGGEGKKAHVELGPVPHGYAVLENQVTQVGGTKRSVVIRPVRREGEKEVFRVSGQIGRAAAPLTLYASVSNPESHISHAFAAMLRTQGIKVEKDFGGAKFGAMEGGAREIASLDGQPLIDLVRLFNTYSNNFMTEQVFLALGNVAGGPASISRARQVAEEFLKQRAGCKDAVMENGSGLSWNTQISARCFVETLQSAYRDFRVFADLLGSLPVGGQTGTLRTRFRHASGGFEPLKVRAKTGTLWSRHVVTSLVGFTQAASGELVAFALVENDRRNDPGLLQGLKDWEDRCVELMQQLRL
jgi:D-alanyl-D-alanine carboxypeptidase/D-alanyl-D-alanine-endopeptidase (penicillin-binding protein 4)